MRTEDAETHSCNMDGIVDGVYNARDTAVRHAKEVYHGSDLYLWRRAYVDAKITATKGLQ